MSSKWQDVGRLACAGRSDSGEQGAGSPAQASEAGRVWGDQGEDSSDSGHGNSGGKQLTGAV